MMNTKNSIMDLFCLLFIYVATCVMLDAKLPILTVIAASFVIKTGCVFVLEWAEKEDEAQRKEHLSIMVLVAVLIALAGTLDTLILWWWHGLIGAYAAPALLAAFYILSEVLDRVGNAPLFENEEEVLSHDESYQVDHTAQGIYTEDPGPYPDGGEQEPNTGT